MADDGRWGTRNFISDWRRPHANWARWLLVPALALLVVRVVQGHHYVRGFDLLVYWQGARAFLHDANPYVNDVFVTPPAGALVLMPLRLFSLDNAYVVMQIVNAVALVAAIFVVLRRLLRVPPANAFVASVAITAVASPTFTTIGFGSLNALILLSFALSIAASLDGDERATGLWFGVGLALKPVLAPLWVVFLVQRRWRAAMWSAVPTLAGSTVAVVYNPKMLHFLDDGLPHIFKLNTQFFRVNMSIEAFVNAAKLPHGLASLGRGVAVLLTLGVAYLVWRWHRTSATGRFGGTVAWLELGSVLFIGTLLASNFAWRYYIVFLLPLFALALRRDSLAYNPIVWVGAVMALPPDGVGLNDTLPRVLAVGRHTGGVALILLGVGFEAWRRRNAPSELGEGDPALGQPRLGAVG